MILLIKACGSNCASCSTNGPTLCDPNGCDANYMYDTATKTCGGKFLFYILTEEIMLKVYVWIKRVFKHIQCMPSNKHVPEKSRRIFLL